MKLPAITREFYSLRLKKGMVKGNRFEARIPHWTEKEIRTATLTIRGAEIGEVQINPDGTVDGKIAEETPDQLRKLCYEMATNFSIAKD